MTKHEEAARLVADDRMSNAQIAQALGMSRQNLDLWKLDAQFRARVAELVQAAREAALAEAIAVKAERIRDYQDLRARLWATITARAQSALEDREKGDAFGRAPAPGAEHGLMVRKLVPMGKGLMEEWAVDTAVIAEMRNLDKQAAQEMGEWTERKEVSAALDVTDSRTQLLGRLHQLAARSTETGSSGGPDRGGSSPPAL